MGGVWPLVIVECDPASDGGLGLRSGFPSMQIDAFILQGPPEALDEDVVDTAPFPIHRDAGADPFQPVGPGEGGELAALKLGVDADKWTVDHVGTIHTVQGREVDTVILLLGAPKSSQRRARQWAASLPNIVNVAVSRAKQNLYVVGSAAAWAGAGTSFQVLQNQLMAGSG